MTIHVIKDADGVEIWSDCEPNLHASGRCIGSGPTIEDACRDALVELRADLDALERLALVVRTARPHITRES